MVPAMSSSASTWKLIKSAPALAKASTYRFGDAIIKCTSKNNLEYGRMVSIMGKPKEMEGTNMPSITSMCRYFTPLPSKSTSCSPSSQKFAAKIDGDKIFTFFSRSLFKGPFLYNNLLQNLPNQS